VSKLIESFDYGNVEADIKADRLKAYMSADDWAFLAENGITMDMVAKDLRKVMNVTAFDFTTTSPSRVQEVVMELIFETVKV
jgi:hypothetical protein